MVLPEEVVRGASAGRSLPRLLSRSWLSVRRSRNEELALAGELPRPKPPWDGAVGRLLGEEAAGPRRDEELDRWATAGRSREGEGRLPVPSSRDCFRDSGLWPGLLLPGGDLGGGWWGATAPCS